MCKRYSDIAISAHKVNQATSCLKHLNDFREWLVSPFPNICNVASQTVAVSIGEGINLNLAALTNTFMNRFDSGKARVSLLESVTKMGDGTVYRTDGKSITAARQPPSSYRLTWPDNSSESLQVVLLLLVWRIDWRGVEAKTCSAIMAIKDGYVFSRSRLEKDADAPAAPLSPSTMAFSEGEPSVLRMGFFTLASWTSSLLSTVSRIGRRSLLVWGSAGTMDISVRPPELEGRICDSR